MVGTRLLEYLPALELLLGWGNWGCNVGSPFVSFMIIICAFWGL